MPTEFGEVLTGQIFIDGETGPIGWSGIQTVSTLLDEDIQNDQSPIRMDYDKEISFDCNFKLSKSGFKLLFLGWRARDRTARDLLKGSKEHDRLIILLLNGGIPKYEHQGSTF